MRLKLTCVVLALSFATVLSAAVVENEASSQENALRGQRDGGLLGVKLDVNNPRAAAETPRFKLKSLFGIAAAGIAKVGIIAVIKFIGLVALVFKALFVSKLALGLAVILTLSKLLWQQQSVTYEVVSHPHVSHTSSSLVGDAHGLGHDSYTSGLSYSRSGAQADNLAYNSYVPK